MKLARSLEACNIILMLKLPKNDYFKIAPITVLTKRFT